LVSGFLVAIFDHHNLNQKYLFKWLLSIHFSTVQVPFCCNSFTFFRGQKKETEAEISFNVIESALKVTVIMTLGITSCRGTGG
jgi:hypothetical protein